MANAPTHPPNRSNHGGSPPKGPRRMRKSSKKLTPAETRVRLTTLSMWLKHPKPADALFSRAEFAEAVDAVLEPGGAEQLKEEQQGNKNLALWISKDMKDAIVAACREAKEAGEGSGNLTDDVDRAFRLFVAGKFTPRPPIRAKRGANIEKANLNVRPSGTFRDQAEELLEAKSAELGWKVTISRVAVSYLLDLYDIDEEEFTVKSGTGTVVRLQMPASLLTHFRKAEADSSDVSLDRLAEDAFRAALAGEFVPPKVPYGSQKGQPRLNVWVDAALYEELRNALPVLSSQAGYPVGASSVATAWMKSQLGEPAE